MIAVALTVCAAVTVVVTVPWSIAERRRRWSA